MQRVRGEFDRLGEPPGQRIADVLKFLVHHRGIEAEHALVSAFGQARLKGFYNGEEPLFSELEELANILSVPLSIFQIVSPGDFAELDIAWAEILYHARELDRRDREKLALSLVELIREARGDDISLLEKLRHKKAKS